MMAGADANEPKRKTRIEIVERDYPLSHHIGRLVEAEVDHVLSPFFGSDRSTALRRLRKLVTVGLLRAWRPVQAGPNIYTLTSRGARVLGEAGYDVSELHVGRVGPHPNLHLRAINDVLTAFLVAGRNSADYHVDAFFTDRDLRRCGGSPPPPYIPDLVVALSTPRGRMVLIIEVDAGEETHAVFSTKTSFTVACWRSGRDIWGARPGTWRPMVFVPSAGRARGLAQVAVESGGGALWLVAQLDRLGDVGAFGRLFAHADAVAATPRAAAIEYTRSLAPLPSTGAP